MTSDKDACAVVLASDHGGYALKQVLRLHLEGRGVGVRDLGVKAPDSVDYPDYARELAEAVLEAGGRGILLCGTGIGMSIAVNRFPGIRGALCHDHFTAVASRRHNNANVLVLGGRTTGPEVAMEVVDAWLDTPFDGGRHARRLAKIEGPCGPEEGSAS